jgi:hypothetical protein
MNRATKWVGLLGACLALAAGPGCMLFDDDYDDYDDPRYSEYQRESPRPAQQQQRPVEETQPGVYQDKR